MILIVVSPSKYIQLLVMNSEYVMNSIYLAKKKAPLTFPKIPHSPVHMQVRGIGKKYDRNNIFREEECTRGKQPKVRFRECDQLSEKIEEMTRRHAEDMRELEEQEKRMHADIDALKKENYKHKLEFWEVKNEVMELTATHSQEEEYHRALAQDLAYHHEDEERESEEREYRGQEEGEGQYRVQRQYRQQRQQQYRQEKQQKYQQQQYQLQKDRQQEYQQQKRLDQLSQSEMQQEKILREEEKQMQVEKQSKVYINYSSEEENNSEKNNKSNLFKQEEDRKMQKKENSKNIQIKVSIQNQEEIRDNSPIKCFKSNSIKQLFNEST